MGTNDIKKAEKALRDAEEEWYGKDHEEEPIMGIFDLTDIETGSRLQKEIDQTVNNIMVVYKEGIREEVLPKIEMSKEYRDDLDGQVYRIMEREAQK